VRPGTVVFLVLLMGLWAGLAGCARPPAGPDAAQAGGPGLSKDEVNRQDVIAQWANGYCVAVGSLVGDLATMPSVDPSSPRRAVQTSGALLGSMIAGLDKAAAGLKALPPAPVAGADAVRDNMVAEFAGVRADAAAAKQRLDKAGAAPTIDQSTLNAARGPLDEVSRLDVLAGFETVPDLLTAAAHAPVCQQLTEHATSSSSPSASPTP
jgi:hypothetical protein